MVEQRLRIADGGLAAEIAPFGAELQRLTDADGRDLQWSGDPAVWKGRAPILFPVIGMLSGGEYRLDGRAYTMPKHGFARESHFEAVSHEADALLLRLRASEQTRAHYPFAFRLDIAFKVAGAALTVAATIANEGDRAMPASFGFHPALRWPLPYGAPRADHRIVFAEREPAPIRRIDGAGLLTPHPHPTPVEGDTLRLEDALFLDDALIFDALASRSVRYGAEGAPQIEVAFHDFPTLGIWTKPGGDYVCIEPWQGIADPQGFTGDIRDKPGIFEIAPGAERRLAMTLTLTDGSKE